jgi:hypothetical protein
MVAIYPITHERQTAGMVYAWTSIGVMWAFWISFVIFLAEPRQVLSWWPLPIVDGRGSLQPPWLAAVIDLSLVALFGLQHSVMARPWFKQHVMRRLPGAFERCTNVHMANLALFTLILYWQPIPIDVWSVGDRLARQVLWLLFAAGWLILFPWSVVVRHPGLAGPRPDARVVRRAPVSDAAPQDRMARHRGGWYRRKERNKGRHKKAPEVMSKRELSPPGDSPRLAAIMSVAAARQDTR